ncbi:lipolytic protein G-D-S-L family [Parasphaerochaeta coccoides DSM 17374]|uniref:Lipolytic protein G-D-S-L family n=2 Tax=Parasphaerochaeta TaxID=3062336 RepID=F4GKE6_PARC1|nr:lipolytic protein G-D-S-L family [Parasphaerochaeta coccoides DSM 17374]
MVFNPGEPIHHSSRTLHLLGDSTCSIKESRYRPETGWGEEFSPFLAPGWSLANWAVNGLSTRSVLSSGVFDKTLDSLAAGDWVIVQFGHNEPKPDEERHTDPWTSFTENLKLIVTRIRENGGNPLFLSSIARRQFIDGKAQHTHGDYPQAMKQVALKLDIPYIDINHVTMDILDAMGEETSKDIFLHLKPEESPNYPKGCADDTHLCSWGALFIARIIYEQVASRFCDLPFLGSTI